VDHAEYSTGDLARATGNTVRTIRFYEEQGLLPPAVLSEGGHRRYTEEDLEKLRLIGDLRELGLPLAEIRSALDLRSGCESTVEFAQRFQEILLEQIHAAERRLERLRRVKRELTDALAAIRSRLSCGEPSSRCPCSAAATPGMARIVKVLARGGLCDNARCPGKGGPKS
jgi:MerR family Zn(II)-responsive transcriptional regulator of zntA